MPQESGGTYAHLLSGVCRCGITHGTRIGGGKAIGSSSSNGATGSHHKEPARYVYEDESGVPLFCVNIIGHGSAKIIWQEHWDGASWTKGLNGCKRVLFRLKELHNAHLAKTVYLVEGERDVETLRSRDRIATTSSGGAQSWHLTQDHARHVLAGRCVCVIADRDDVGHKYAREVEASLRGAVQSVAVLECTKGKDVTEHLANGGTLDVGAIDGLVPMQDTPASPRVDTQQDAPRVELDVPEDDAREPDVIVDEPSPSSPGHSPKTDGATPEPSGPSPTPSPVTLAQAFEARRKRGPLVRMSTDIEGIDRATCGGIPFGSTVFVVGAPDAAKTLLLFTIATAWARRDILAGFMAVDEEIDDLVTRLAQQTAKEISAEGEVIRNFTRSDYEVGSTEMITRIKSAIGELPILFFDSAWTVERATAHVASEAKRLGKRSAFFADSLQTVRSEATPEDASERRVVADNAKALRQAAVRFGIATLATSESNREYSKAKRKGEAGIAMSAGAESRAVEFTARALFVLSSVEDSNLIEVEIPKNKLGPRKTFHLAIDRATQTLSDAPSPEIAPKVDRQAARDERRRLQVTETSERKERERAEAERRKVAEAAEKMVAEDRKLVALLREDRVWLKTEARAALGGGKDPASATIARARAYLVESKGANNSTVITLDATKLPESLR
jgi:KaiC/GvpD/RAD55 family RecA-like ATPase/5S rRNA maturation endonuclease (ribonuclease M5)